MKKYSLITVLGWEDRFFLGLEETLKNFSLNKIILIRFKDYLHMNNMEENIERINSLSLQYKFDLSIIDLSYNDSIDNWNILESSFKNAIGNYLFNITTIPRETIWALFFFIKTNINTINYIYFKPKSYCKEWLTKNHKSPRLLFKHSGIFDLNKELVLFIIAGFDLARLQQIIDFYEPSKIVVFFQNGNQYNNEDRNKDFEIYKNKENYCEVIELDTYKVEESSKIILSKYNQYKDDYNIIIDSQGPKVSALSVYDVYLKSENKIGLAYVAAKDFNSNYSKGIDNEYVEGEFSFK